MRFPGKMEIASLLMAVLLLTGCAAQPEMPEPTAAEPQETVQLLSQEETTAPTEPEVTEQTAPELEELAFIDIGGFRYPDAFGQPVLGQEEVNKLAKAGNVNAAAKAITHVGDALYYMMARPEFSQPTQACELFIQLLEGDYGRLNYVQSAWQVLKRHEGQCVSMSNLTHYLLKDNYDEVGYVSVRSPGDGHVMSYILEDGVYYLVNPVDYTEDRPINWLDSYPGLLGCAEDFQEIADSLVSQMRLGDNQLVNLVHMVKSPGDFVQGEGGRYYPIGTEVIPYYGNKSITYIEAGYEWDSQTRIDY